MNADTANHVQFIDNDGKGWGCAYCDEEWPCPTAQLVAERDALQEELARLDDENDALKVERDAAIFEAARLRHEDLAEKWREVESLRTQLTETRSERDDLAINYSKANARVESLRTALAEAVAVIGEQHTIGKDGCEYCQAFAILRAVLAGGESL